MMHQRRRLPKRQIRPRYQPPPTISFEWASIMSRKHEMILNYQIADILERFLRSRTPPREDANHPAKE